MIFTSSGSRWMVDARGFLRYPTEQPDIYDAHESRVIGDESWVLYGWLDLP